MPTDHVYLKEENWYISKKMHIKKTSCDHLFNAAGQNVHA